MNGYAEKTIHKYRERYRGHWHAIFTWVVLLTLGGIAGGISSATDSDAFAAISFLGLLIIGVPLVLNPPFRNRSRRR